MHLKLLLQILITVGFGRVAQILQASEAFFISAKLRHFLISKHATEDISHWISDKESVLLAIFEAFLYFRLHVWNIMCNTVSMGKIFFNYAPNNGALGFGPVRLSVSPSVRLSVRYAFCWL